MHAPWLWNLGPGKNVVYGVLSYPNVIPMYFWVERLSGNVAMEMDPMDWVNVVKSHLKRYNL